MMTTEQKAAPRPAWEVLREAVQIIADHPQHTHGDHAFALIYLEGKAHAIEAAAAPKPPTVEEAAAKLVAHINAIPYRDLAGLRLGDAVPHFEALKAALARAEAGQ